MSATVNIGMGGHKEPALRCYFIASLFDFTMHAIIINSMNSDFEEQLVVVT
jgi:hypothetical protein